MSLVVNGALLLGLCAALVLAVLLLRSWPQLGGLLAAGFVLAAWELPAPPPVVEIGGQSIYLADLASIVFLLTAATGLHVIRARLGRFWWGWALLGALLIASFVRGLLLYDLGPVVVEARTVFYPAAATLWALSVPWEAERARVAIRRFSLLVGWGLVVVAVAHVVVYGFGGASDFVDATTGFDQTQRPLVAGQALSLLLCATVVLSAWARERRPFLAVSGVAFLLVVVLAQQRSVWVAALAVGVLALVLGGEHGRVGYLLGAFGLVALAVVIASFGLAESLVSTLNGSVVDTGTLMARQTSWTALTAKSWVEGPASVLFGQPFGAGFGRFEGVDRWVEYAPHNWYVSLFLRAGLLGLIGYAVTLIGIIARGVRSPSRIDRLEKSSILAAIVVFCGAYSLLWYTAPFFGWASTTSPLPDRRAPDAGVATVAKGRGS